MRRRGGGHSATTITSVLGSTSLGTCHARKCTTSERQSGGELRVRLPELILEDFSNSDRVDVGGP